MVLLCSDSAGNSSEEAAFNRSCSTAREVAMATADFCPEAVLVVSAEPVNSLVPLMAEVSSIQTRLTASPGARREQGLSVIVAQVLEHAGVLDCGRVLGVASVDAVRAGSLLARMAGLPAHRVHVPVVGGRSAFTAVPVISQARPFSDFTSVSEHSVCTCPRSTPSESMQESNTLMEAEKLPL